MRSRQLKARVNRPSQLDTRGFAAATTAMRKGAEPSVPVPLARLRMIVSYLACTRYNQQRRANIAPARINANAMGPNAYTLIDRYGLARPRSFNVKELATLDDNVSVYVQARSGPHRLRARIRANAVERWCTRNALGVSDLVRIELSPEVVCGGAAYADPSSGAYIEGAVGHTSGLLEYGFCAARSLLSRQHNMGALHQREQQNAAIDPESWRKIVLSPSVAEDTLETAIGEAIRSLAALLDRATDDLPLLLEWIFSKERGLEYVDAKQFVANPLRYQFHRVFESRPIIVEDSLSPQPPEVYITDVSNFNASNVEHRKYHARLRNQALLCHFLTSTAHVPRIVELT